MKVNKPDWNRLIYGQAFYFPLHDRQNERRVFRNRIWERNGAAGVHKFDDCPDSSVLLFCIKTHRNRIRQVGNRRAENPNGALPISLQR